jgi:hypothetical protein
MSWSLSPAGELLLAGAVLVVVAVAVVWRRRAATTIVGLLAVLLGAVLWSVCSALELSAGDLAGREYWGDLKYVGIVLLPPAFLAFVLQCSGHTRWPRWLGPALAIEPVAVLVLLAGDATHDLVRWYPDGRRSRPPRRPRPGRCSGPTCSTTTPWSGWRRSCWW